MPYNNKFVKSLFISGMVFMILMALLSTTQMISGLNQQAETGSNVPNAQVSNEAETKAIQTSINGPRLTSYTKAGSNIQRRAVQAVSPTNAAISGPSVGIAGTSHTFLANVTGTNPMTYSWDITDLAPVTVANSNSLTDSQSFTWSTPGMKTIILTISNIFGTISTTHNITVTNNVIPPTGVSISGPSSGDTNTSYTFDASTIPISTSVPITYVWQATDQTTVTTTGTLTNSLPFSWSTAGVKTIIVTASNISGTVSSTAHNITISSPAPGSVAPGVVNITGPTDGEPGTNYSFNANIDPSGTTLPITIKWEATDHDPITESSFSLDNLRSFSWNTPGIKTIVVTVSNGAGSVSTTYQFTVNNTQTAPSSLLISGPTTGQISSTHSFTATVSPISTTQPITYVWQATDQTGTTHTGATLTDALSLNWNSIGQKTITVIASNSHGSISNTHQITILDETIPIPPQNVTISGISAGEVGNAYTFNATVGPISTTQPITYVWEATGQTSRLTNALTDSFSVSWSTSGQKTVKVVASNEHGSVTAEHLVTIEDGVVIPPQQVTISGPTSGLINNDYTFTANVASISTTQPMTYVWQATGQDEVTQISGTLTAVQKFNWSEPGEKTVTVKASNSSGTVTTIYQMTVEAAPVAVTINGLETGYAGRQYEFVATVRPDVTTEPITYTWESTDHEPLTLFGGTVTSTQILEWDEPGQKIITIIASNSRGTVQNTHSITIEEAPPISVMIEGLDEGNVDTDYNFVATVGRSYTTVPLTYTWEMSGQPSIVRSSDALVNIVPLSWTIEGPQTITVTAANHLGSVSDTHQINVKRPLLGFVMSDSPHQLRVSETLTYFITVTNNAPLVANDAVLLDELPEDVEFIDAVSSQGSCIEDEGDVTCQLNTLESGQQATIALRMKPRSSGRIINRANISSSTSELQIDGRTIAEDTLVSKPGVGITKVNPNMSFNDVPSIVYLDGFGFSDVLSVVLKGTMTDTLTGTLETVLDVKYVDPVLLVAEIPAGLAPGFYDIVANTATEQAVVSKGYELKDFADFEDLYALPEWFSTHPRPVRVGKAGSGISLTLEHLGGQGTVENVTVEFRLDDVNGEILGRGTIASLAPSTKGSTELVSWQPKISKAYTLFAIIDPDNEIEESDELNNVITRTVFVLPQAEDTLPPIIESFLIEDDAQTILEQDVTLDVKASDAEELGATGIEAIKFIEFEYILGARRWVPVQRSGWVTYKLAEFDYPWKMIPTFGMRYMQAWSVDGQRNISSEAGAEVIDLLPTEQTGYVGQHGVAFYRFKLKEGETFAATLKSISGDADLHVWGPTGQRWSSNTNGIDNVEFEAPFTATYQIEVHGFTDANYNLIFGSNSNSSLRRMQRVGPKPLPAEIAVPLDNWPEYYEMEPPVIPPGSTLYLPLTAR